MDIPSIYEQKHVKNLRKYERQIEALYRKAIKDAVRFAYIVGIDEVNLFQISKSPSIRNRINQIIIDLRGELYATLANGINEEWTLADEMNVKVIESKYNRTQKTFPPELTALIYDKNEKALKQFISRKTKGLNLSDRVWRSARKFRTELEQGISLAISEGKSAEEAARSLQKYLKEPDKLFRRVRDARGKLQLSNPARLYNPGQGVYRSSFKNALRLMRTETNMAYRESDVQRWQGLDFVRGYEVRLSANHPRFDICDHLAGRYPKTFIFNGWHPQCLCYSVPILMTSDEYDKYEDAILSGEKRPTQSVNTVKDVPPGFKDWVDKNAERVSGWQSTPYWVRDNFKNGDITKGLKNG